MGLLDDAIREHLELKRRHGADAEEVARQEHEALGAPARGEFAQPQGGGAPSAPDAPEEPLTPEQAEDAAGYEEEPWAADAGLEAPEFEPVREREPRPAGPEPHQVPPPAAPEAAGAPPAPGAPDAVAPDEDDVLGATPDFLQETPEHDRLWFEQKPPRDFDWDK
ncbi:MAG: hypothetical protein QOE28_108 [Solirubrobacteraceae bacterium]|nr:hypothetical protein [Solirubrobacteraceae bacterium]